MTETAGSCVKGMFNLVRNYHAVFQCSGVSAGFVFPSVLGIVHSFLLAILMSMSGISL